MRSLALPHPNFSSSSCTLYYCQRSSSDESCWDLIHLDLLARYGYSEHWLLRGEQIVMNKSGSKATNQEVTAVIQVRSDDCLGKVMAVGMERHV